jgi:hypothetical protein
MILNWYFWFTITVQITFLVEIIIAIRLYRRQRAHSKSRSLQNQSVPVLFSPPPLSMHPAPEKEAKTSQLLYITHLPLTQLHPPSNQHSWIRIKKSLLLGAVFLITFIIIHHLLRPFTYPWALSIIPVLVPLPFLVLPSLYDLKSLGTLSCLLIGLSLGALSLLQFLR